MGKIFSIQVEICLKINEKLLWRFGGTKRRKESARNRNGSRDDSKVKMIIANLKFNTKLI